MPRNSIDSSTDGGLPDKPQTPASEPAGSQPASPVKKRRKISRSLSIPAQPIPVFYDFHGPGGFLSNHHMMTVHSQFEDPNHMHSPMNSPMHMGHGPPLPGQPPGQPMMHLGAPPHMLHGIPHGHTAAGHHLSHPLPPHSQPHIHPASHGHPPGGARFMRPGPIPSQHMHPGPLPHGQPVVHPHQAMTHSSMAGPGPPGGPVPSAGPVPPGAPMHQYSGVPPSGRVYPNNRPMIFNSSNPNAPPIYPCGNCHKEVHDSDQAILCESGCNFWFHRQCTGLTEIAYQLLTKEVYAEWVCDQCLQKKPIPLIKVKP